MRLNEQNTLPMDINEAVETVQELEKIDERLDHLEDRRLHELRRMPDLIKEYTIKAVETYLEGEEYDDPVLHDVDYMKNQIEKAVNNIQIK